MTKGFALNNTSKVVILAALLLLIFCVDGLCPSIILPLFPKIASELSVTRIELKQSISFITAGIFLSRLLMGLNTSHISFKSIFIALFIILGLGGVLSAHATTIQWFWLGEFLQGFGIGAAYPLIKIVINSNNKAALGKILSYVGSFSAFIFFLAPIIGVRFYANWHDTFYVIVTASIGMLILASLLSNEGMHSEKTPLKLFQLIKTIFSNRQYILIVLIYSIRYAAFVIFLSWLPFLLIQDLHINHLTFAQLMIFPSLALFLGSVLNGVMKKNYLKMIWLAEFIFLLAGGGVVLGFFMHIVSVATIIGFCFLFCVGSAVISVQSNVMIPNLFEQPYTKYAMMFASVLLNLSATVATFFLAMLKLDEGLILGSVFLSVFFLNGFFLFFLRRLRN